MLQTYAHTYLLTNVGSLLRHASMNSLKGLLNSPNKVGGLFFGMRNRTLIGCISELGGSPLASSIAVIPNDQMSAWKKGKITFSTKLNAITTMYLVTEICIYIIESVLVSVDNAQGLVFFFFIAQGYYSWRHKWFNQSLRTLANEYSIIFLHC